MAPLRNARHEKFVLGLCEGLSAVDAHEQAGYQRDRGNATRLRQNPRVIARLTELQTVAAENTTVTIETLLGELEEARLRATSVDQLSAATAAIMGKAKLAGLLVNRTEIGGPGDFSKCDSIEDVAAEMAQQWIENTGNSAFLPITAQDEQAVADIMIRAFNEVDEFLAGIQKRPLIQNYHQKALGLLTNGKSSPT